MSASENGWMPAKARPDQCQWITVPGTSVSLQIMKGQPSAILRAAAADFNAYIEPLRNADSASWTPTNSVATSNHLNGTACDWNWNSHPFRKRGTFTAAQMVTIREMLDFYEGTLFWAGDWNNPVDEMHWQLGYGSYNNPETQSFIDRKIRSDGYSTFRRGPTQARSKADGYALAIISEGQRRAVTPRGIQIALATCLVESGNPLKLWANAKVAESLAIPHDAVGSDGFSVGLFQQQVVRGTNGWWWGDARTCMDPTLSAGLFYDRLVKLDYEHGDPGAVAQQIQRSAFPDRYGQQFPTAVDLYNRLAGTPLPEEDFMSALSPQEQRALYDEIMARRNSRSPLRHVGEGAVGDMADMMYNTDGSVHVMLVQRLAALGDPDSLALLREVANLNLGQYPDRAHDKQLAQAILNDLANQVTPGSAPASGQTPGTIPVTVPPAPVAVPPPAPAVPPQPPSVPPDGGVTSTIAAAVAEIDRLTQAAQAATDKIRS